MQGVEYLIGVDGGGTGTRICIADIHGKELVRASGGPSGLGLGIENAWRAINVSIASGFTQLGLNDWSQSQCAIGLGLAGVHNPTWAQAFLQIPHEFAHLKLDHDGYTTLLGAHNGKPGAIVAVGTGTVGEAWLGGDTRRSVSGWGFPSGDEGSGAWLGLRAAQLTQKALDGRLPMGSLAQAVVELAGGSRDDFVAWLGRADQTLFASLSPLVVQNAAKDGAADTLLRRAGVELESIATALDQDHKLPLALCGGLAEVLRPWLPTAFAQRAIKPQADAVSGALHLISLALA